MTSFAQKWNTPFDMVPYSNASALNVWKSWWQDIDAHFIASGLVAAADTGQIDFTTVTTAPLGTSVGYKVYALNDALQATMPIIIKLTFGSSYMGAATSVVASQIKVEIGSATDGAGNLTAAVDITASFPSSFNANDTDGTDGIGYGTSLQNAICYNETYGFFGVQYAPNMVTYSGGSGFSQLSFFIQRSVDVNGAPTANGFTVYMPDVSQAGVTGSTTYMSSWYFDGTTTFTGQYWAQSVGNNYQHNPGATYGGPQVQRAWTFTPLMNIVPNLLTLSTGDIPYQTEFTVTDFALSKNFIALSPYTGGWVDSLNSGRCLAMLFQ